MEELKPTGKKPNYDTAQAKKIVRQRIKEMISDVKASTPGKSRLRMDERGQASGRYMDASTFPKYYRTVKAKNFEDFVKIALSEKGKRYQRIKDEAISNLEHGYRNDHGHAGPDKDFLVASKQVYDNKGVIFRYVGGRIVPMRVGRANIRAKLKGGGFTPF